MIDRKLSFL